MNSGAVVTIEATQEKLAFGGSALFPKFSICDPMNLYQKTIAKWCRRCLYSCFRAIFNHMKVLQDRIAEEFYKL
jgi:alcohol dehydrogenase YqhD (iron-dependent ADH family)